MEILGKETGLCCEFGAWDAIHLSNTRRLMEHGWRGLMIEADHGRFEDLLKTLSNLLKRFRFAPSWTAENSLAKIAARAGIEDRFDPASMSTDWTIRYFLHWTNFSNLLWLSVSKSTRVIGQMTPHRSPWRLPKKDAGSQWAVSSSVAGTWAIDWSASSEPMPSSFMRIPIGMRRF